jgi:hypothetical protein
LESLLKDGWADKLSQLGEINCSKEVLDKLRKISSKTIDRKLKHQKEIKRIRQKYRKKIHPLLYQKIPVKLSDEWDRFQLGNIQTYLIEHCGDSVRGEYINTISNTDISTGWWEGEAIISRNQDLTCKGLDNTRKRFPLMAQNILTGIFLDIVIKKTLDFQDPDPIKRMIIVLLNKKTGPMLKSMLVI